MDASRICIKIFKTPLFCIFQAGWSGGQCSPFQWEYVRLRGELLGALGRVLAVCRAYCAQPPPAIALSQAQVNT